LENTSSVHTKSILSGYQGIESVFDEIRFSEGGVRPHWNKFLSQISKLGIGEFGRRWTLAQRMVYENGFTFSAYGDSPEDTRPWDLNAIPLMISFSDLTLVNQGLKQRARLLNEILSDLYGDQTLIRDGHLPPNVLYSHPNFWRSIHGLIPKDQRFLHLYSADLARQADGSWIVVGDRTESPTGMGYALENRIVISRMLPAIIQKCHVRRLAPFFITLRKTLRDLAPRNQENPHVVLLSQGPSNPNYFEDVYLARYLGYTLVTGEDLTVRNNEVRLKTLGGLIPIDVILRRLPDSDCDPLELDPKSMFGVVGLLGAIREGNVAVLNCPGSGLIESPIFLPFLPKLSEILLGEKLLIPSAHTLWCGNTESCNQVINNLDSYIIKPAYRGSLGRKIANQINSATQDRLKNLIQDKPQLFVAQSYISRSTSAVWQGNHASAKYVAFRTYLIASNKGYQVMPGGLCRLGSQPSELARSITAGEASADVWEVSDEEVDSVSLLSPQGQLTEIRRTGNELPSRVADHFFWLGRHLERAEQISRVLRTILNRIVSNPQPSDLSELNLLWSRYQEMIGVVESPLYHNIEDLSQSVLNSIQKSIYDQMNQSNLISTLSKIHNLASIVRDRLSFDSWKIIYRLNQLSQKPENSIQDDVNDYLEILDSIISDLAAFSGLMAETMTRSQAWRFLEMGRRIERSTQMLGLLRAFLSESEKTTSAALEVILEVADSLMTYRSRYLANLQIGLLLDLIVLDEGNPRSVMFQIVSLEEHIKHLPKDMSSSFYSPEERICSSTIHKLKMFNPELFHRIFDQGVTQEFDQILESTESKLLQLSEVISHRYLIHANVPRPLDLFQIGQ
jgi:uncharacterized circularly permuted ATP-grasp superfamily protein/uncharacterized alpha-E superfamily protein